MHAFMRRLHSAPGTAPAAQTKGLILAGGWRYDLHGWVLDTVVCRGQVRQLRQRTITLAGLAAGARVLDVGCGTGTLALEVQGRLGSAGRVVGVDPSPAQIARARAKAARRHLRTEFQLGVIEQLAFPDQTFDVVLATLMMHHLPAPLKRQGLAEIARVLTPGGCLVLADFTPRRERQGRAARFHAGGSAVPELVALVEDAGFHPVDTEEVLPVRFSAFPGAGLVRARKR
jgi:ubiquinone/menaquinone biosynthesis C-methylase UbiE